MYWILNVAISVAIGSGFSRYLYSSECYSCHVSAVSSGELRFKPGDGELEIAVNVIDDNIPEEEESFRVRLKNPKGGAEISFNGHVTVVIPSNDDAHGIVAFAQVRGGWSMFRVRLVLFVLLPFCLTEHICSRVL